MTDNTEVKYPQQYTLVVKRDNLLDFPELWMEVYIAGDKYEEKAFAEMLIRARCTKAESPETADMVIFTGGEDVDPLLYDETPHRLTRYDQKRDEDDLALYYKCLEEGIPMFGVCRGAQFLHVMNGGKLYQHVTNHTGDHGMWDLKKKYLLPTVSSVHHQMCIENEKGGMEVLGETGKDCTRWKNNDEKVEGYKQDVEAFFYRETCCLGVQGHPEYKGYERFMKWTLHAIEDNLINNPDLKMYDGYRRIDKDILNQRKLNHFVMM